jgi:hypothetical protein
MLSAHLEAAHLMLHKDDASIPKGEETRVNKKRNNPILPFFFLVFPTPLQLALLFFFFLFRCQPLLLFFLLLLTVEG